MSCGPASPPRLLLYLIVQGTWVSRDSLAELLSPELGEQQARHNLRLNLSRALKLPWAQGVEVEPSRLRFEASSDVAEVQRAAAAGDFAQVMALGRQPLLWSFSLELLRRWRPGPKRSAPAWSSCFWKH